MKRFGIVIAAIMYVVAAFVGCSGDDDDARYEDLLKQYERYKEDSKAERESERYQDSIRIFENAKQYGKIIYDGFTYDTSTELYKDLKTGRFVTGYEAAALYEYYKTYTKDSIRNLYPIPCCNSVECLTKCNNKNLYSVSSVMGGGFINNIVEGYLNVKLTCVSEEEQVSIQWLKDNGYKYVLPADYIIKYGLN